MGKIILLYVNSSRRQMSCQINVIAVDSQLDYNLQTKFSLGILEHIDKWDSAFIYLGKLRKLIP